MFVSVDGKAKEVKEIFAGGQDGKAHKITEMFGSVDGIAKRIFSMKKEENGFDQFTWAEIKQLANEGKLLEHFNLYDRVTIKLTDVLSKEYRYYTTEEGSVISRFTARQDKLILQITSLTETSMRLSSPYASILCQGIAAGVYEGDGLLAWQKGVTTKAPFEEGSNITVTTTNYEDSFYWQFDKVLPEDVKAVATGFEMLKETVEYSTGGKNTIKDKCHVRNLTSPVNWQVTKHNETLPYWYEITDTQFPRKKSAYLYHFKLPDDFRTAIGFAIGKTFLYTSSSSSEYYRTYYYTKSPLISYTWSDKYTSPENGGVSTLRNRQYAEQMGHDDWFYDGLFWDFIPEILIEADK